MGVIAPYNFLHQVYLIIFFKQFSEAFVSENTYTMKLLSQIADSKVLAFDDVVLSFHFALFSSTSIICENSTLNVIKALCLSTHIAVNL